MTTLAIQRTVSGVLTSADSASLSVSNASGTVVVGPVTVAPTSVGAYTYTTAYLSPGLYTASWTFTVSGQPDDVVSRAFQADGPEQVTTGVTLAQIERSVARRVGPYRQYKADVSSTTGALVIRRLQSSISSGDIEDMFILRRGVTTAGVLIPHFVDDDRQRQVDSYDPDTGTISPDRNWTLEPQANEVIEFHYLDPEQELRPVVQAGLRRCYFWDQSAISITGALRRLNLTSSLPWLTSPSSIANIQTGINESITPERRTMWWNPYIYAGSLYLNTDWLAAGDLFVTALRPWSSYVNGETSLTGPDDDWDVLGVDLEYAVRACHVQCWLDLTDRLTPVAAQGLRLTPSQAASAFTMMSKGIDQQIPDQIVIRWETDEVLSQVGNAWGE